MWNNKKKAITFSFDDGVKQDERLIAILNKYGLKATFNINSSLLGLEGNLNWGERKIAHNKINPYDVKSVYQGHEVAVHTLTHPNLTTLNKEAIEWQVECDRKVLSSLVGYEVKSMAYPCGHVNNDDRTAEIIKNGTGIQFVRTITHSYSFDLQDNLYRFNPTIHFMEWEKLFALAEEFLQLKAEEPKLFYIWGHSYELDITEGSWEKFENFCALISGREDIFYGSNKEVLL